MSGLKEYPELDKLKLTAKDKHRRHEETLSSSDRIAELLSEIYERIEWLKEMNELGEGKKHRQVIDAEVTERLREIKKLEEKLAREKRDGLQEERRDSGRNQNNWRWPYSLSLSLLLSLSGLFIILVNVNFSFKLTFWRVVEGVVDLIFSIICLLHFLRPSHTQSFCKFPLHFLLSTLVRVNEWEK